MNDKKDFLIKIFKKDKLFWETYDENENQMSLLNYIERNRDDF